MASAIGITEVQFPSLFDGLRKFERDYPEYKGRSTRQIAVMLILDGMEAKIKEHKDESENT